MKKFRFRLQTLLDQRKSAEDLLQVELSEIRREESAEIARLADLHAKLARTCEELAEKRGPQSASLAELQYLDEYAGALRDDIKVQELTIEAVRQRVEAKREEVAEAMKARKVIEALREKQERDYLTSLARAEQAALDEMASLRYARGA